MDNSFEDFPVYKKSLSLIGEINELCKSINNLKFNFLKDQIRRASSSIVLNIAEGSGKWTKKDKCNFYRISCGSAYECIAAIDLFVAYQLVDENNANILKGKVQEIANDLQSLVISVKKRTK